MGSKKKILYLEASSGYGGSGMALYSLLKFLDKEKFQPHVIVFNEGPQFQKIRALGIPFETTDYKEFCPKTSKRLCNYICFIIQFIFRTIPAAVRIYGYIKNQSIDIAHVNTNIISGLPLIVASRLAGIPCVCHIRQTRKLIRIERFFSSFIREFVVLNKTVNSWFEAYQMGSKTILIYDGVNLDHFDMADHSSIREQYHLGDVPIIGLPGRIFPGKGHESFLRMAAVVHWLRPSVRFLVLGSAPTTEKNLFDSLVSLQKELGLSDCLVFTGWRNDLRQVINDLTIGVMPSISPEGLGTVTLEMMALKKPVVASRVPGTQDIVVDGKTGYLFEPGNHEEMAKYIIELLDNPTLSAKMGMEGRRVVEEKFDIRNNVKQIEKLYENAFKKRTG